MSESKQEIPKWACPKCGKVFRAITQDSLDDKAENHLSDCDADAIEGSKGEDAKYTATVKPPRDLDEYAISDHFHSMYTRRENPEATSETIETVLEHGQIKSTHVAGRYIFEATVDSWRWWIVVKMNDEAFYKPHEKHVAVTIFSPDSGSHEGVKKYV